MNGIILPIYKEAQIADCENNRVILKLGVVPKVYQSLLHSEYKS